MTAPENLLPENPRTPQEGAEIHSAGFSLTADTERFREAFLYTPVGMSITDLQGRFLHVNPALCKMTGYAAAELTGRTFMSITHPEDIEPNLNVLNRLAAGEIPSYTLEKRFIRKDGGITWVRLSASAIRDGTGKFAAAFALTENITARKAAEEALFASEKLYGAVMETAAEGIAVVDADLRLVFGNQKLRQMTGYTVAEAQGKTVTEFLAPEERSQSPESIELIKAGKRNRFERHLLRRDGSILPASISATALHTPAGDFAGVLYMITDRSETERFRLELDSVRQRLQRAQEEVGAGCWELDLLSGVVTSDQTNAALFGTVADGARTRIEDWADLVHPEDRPAVVEVVQRAARSGGAEEAEFRVLRPDGTVRWLFGKIHTTVDADGVPLRVTGVNIDITGRKRAEAALDRAQERLAIAEEAAGVGIWDLDIRSGVVICTDEHFRLYGLEPTENGRTTTDEWAGRLHPDDQERVRREIDAALHGSGDYEVEFRVVRPDGSISWLLSKARVFFDDAGQPVRATGCDIDVTETKRVEAALRQSEDRFRTAFANAAIGMVIAAPDGCMVVANKAMCALTGYTEEELRTFPFGGIVHPDDRDTNLAHQRRLESREISSYVLEKRYLRKDGGVVWVRTSVSAVRDEAGRLVNTIALAEDITARVDAERALRLSEGRFRTAAEHATDVIAEVDLDTHEAKLFGRCDEIFGHPASEAGEIVRNWRSLIHSEDIERVAAAVRQALSDSGPLDIEFRAHRPNGPPAHIAVRGTRMAENPRKFLLLLTDVTERKNAEETASRLAAIVRSSENAIISIGLDGSVQTWNRGAEVLYGYKAEEMIGRSILTLCPPEHIEEALDRLAWNRTGHFVNVDRALRRRKDGTVVQVSLRAAPLRDASGNIIGISSITEDITARLAAEQQLRESEERFRRVFEHSPVGMALRAADGSFLRVNATLCNLLGYTEEEFLRMPSMDAIHPADRRQTEELYRKLLNRELPGYSMEKRLLRKDGTYIWAKNTCSAVWNAAGQFVHQIVIVEDITQRRAAEDQLAFQANHDVLTSLPNRRLLEDRVQQAIAYGRRNGSGFALFYIDLDSFKLVNDSLGHLTGDVLLQQVAARLRGAVRESDTLARCGGDEFVLVATDLRGPRSAEIVAEKLRRALAEPFQIGGHDIFAAVSIGISMYPKDGKDTQALQRNADSAMYAAKKAGKNTIRFFTPEMSAAAMERLRLDSQLRRALENGEMSLVYQPQFRASKHVLAGFEALLRWNPESGPVSPTKFVPIAEETGLIVPIGTWVLHQACRQILRWMAAGRGPVRLAVNVSEVQFARADFVKTVRQCLEEHRINPRLLELELTESMVMRDFETTASKMAQLQELGVSIAIDDFGTGYSSLSYLQRLPINALKIDRSFVKDLGRESRAVSLLRALVALCRSLSVRVVVEGIETPRQLEIIRELGCDEVQGFLLGVPSPLSDITPGSNMKVG